MDASIQVFIEAAPRGALSASQSEPAENKLAVYDEALGTASGVQGSRCQEQ